MKPAIICGGEIFTVAEKLEEYNLTIAAASTDLCEAIRYEVKRIKKYEDAYKREVKDGQV